MSELKPLMTLSEAAACTPFNRETLRRAIHNKDPHTFPYVLRAKKDTKNRLLITDRALLAWIELLEDA